MAASAAAAEKRVNERVTPGREIATGREQMPILRI
jgi:hypothetical protein